jgi:hypothetical protein
VGGARRKVVAKTAVLSRRSCASQEIETLKRGVRKLRLGAQQSMVRAESRPPRQALPRAVSPIRIPPTHYGNTGWRKDVTNRPIEGGRYGRYPQTARTDGAPISDPRNDLTMAVEQGEVPQAKLTSLLMRTCWSEPSPSWPRLDRGRAVAREFSGDGLWEEERPPA